MVIVTFLGSCLRTLDNPALKYALEQKPEKESVIACYVEDPTQRLPGAAYTWWTRKSLPLLRTKLDKLHVPLVCIRGSLPSIACALLGNSTSTSPKVTSVYMNRRWGGYTASEDEKFVNMFHDRDIPVKMFTAHTLHEPWTIKTGQGNPYRVYTPFSRQFAAIKPQLLEEPIAQQKDPDTLASVVKLLESSQDLKMLDWANPPQPFDPFWAKEFPWKPGSSEAHKVLEDFLNTRIQDYGDARDIPYEKGTSQLSPYLAHGEISPHRVLDAVRKAKAQLRNSKNSSAVESANTFEKELVWREFQYHLLYHEPDIGWANHNKRFDTFPWRFPAPEDELRKSAMDLKPDVATKAQLEATAAFDCWRSGHTGIPIVDAGMRQLWKMGWMHNRVRMIVASFLTKNLSFHWSVGEQWFWDTLVDADPASNPGNWQWVSGAGADAAPFFRIFNPLRQADNFDQNGAYVRSWVHELKSTPTKEISKLYDRDCYDGESLMDFPSPISRWVDLRQGTERESSSPSRQRKHMISLSRVATPEDEYRLPIVSLKESRATALSKFRTQGKESEEVKSESEDERPKKLARHT